MSPVSVHGNSVFSVGCARRIQTIGRRWGFLSLLLMLIPSGPVHGNVHPGYAERPEAQAFVARMVSEHGFDAERVQALLAEAAFNQRIIDLITRPAEAKPWHEYRKILVTEQRVAQGKAFLAEHRETLRRAEQSYGVPAELIVAVIGVETSYGRYTGSYPVLDALATLAFDYPPRSAFFAKEFEQFLILAREEGLEPHSLKGSYAGAMGYGQFMPSSFRHYAVDFDGDGKRDIWNNPVDAIGSVANYFAVHGWRKDAAVVARAQTPAQDVEALVVKGRADLRPQRTVAEMAALGIAPLERTAPDEEAVLVRLDTGAQPEYWLGLYNFYVITRYNQSALYAMAVHQLSLEIER